MPFASARLLAALAEQVFPSLAPRDIVAVLERKRDSLEVLHQVDPRLQLFLEDLANSVLERVKHIEAVHAASTGTIETLTLTLVL